MSKKSDSKENEVASYLNQHPNYESIQQGDLNELKKQQSSNPAHYLIQNKERQDDKIEGENSLSFNSQEIIHREPPQRNNYMRYLNFWIYAIAGVVLAIFIFIIISIFYYEFKEKKKI